MSPMVLETLALALGFVGVISLIHWLDERRWARERAAEDAASKAAE